MTGTDQPQFASSACPAGHRETQPRHHPGPRGPPAAGLQSLPWAESKLMEARPVSPEGPPVLRAFALSAPSARRGLVSGLLMLCLSPCGASNKPLLSRCLRAPLADGCQWPEREEEAQRTVELQQEAGAQRVVPWPSWHRCPLAQGWAGRQGTALGTPVSWTSFTKGKLRQGEALVLCLSPPAPGTLWGTWPLPTPGPGHNDMPSPGPSASLVLVQFPGNWGSECGHTGQWGTCHPMDSRVGC